LDLVFPGPSPILDFITFLGNPNLHLDLDSLGPGVLNTTCSTTFNPNDPSCSVFPGSPVVLSPSPGGTTVSLSAFGTAHDLDAVTSSWLGQFSTQIPGLTPATIQALILAPGGSLTNSYSGAFTITINQVPEPISLVLIGGGLVVLALLRRSSRVA
jgi:hypothetical protein